MAGLVLEGVHKRYGQIVALQGLSLEAGDGELLVIVGPSGCGKTTALRVTAGLEAPTQGSVRIGERDVTRVPPGGRDVAMVFQSYALFPHMTASENISFGLRASGMRGAEADRRVKDAAALVGCTDLLDRPPAKLSGGERQRVALARALVREPDVFLLDEPLSNLDAQLRAAMRMELRRLQQRLGATMVYVTHDQVEALTLGDRVAVLREGALQQVGGPDDLYDRPANRFVATFIGSPAMNLLPAELVPGGLRAPPFQLAPPRRISPARLAGRKLEVGIRPEDLTLVHGREDGPGRADQGAGHISEATVTEVEPAGNETYVHVEAGGCRLVVRGGARLRPSRGAPVQVAVGEDALHVFDRETGEALR